MAGASDDGVVERGAKKPELLGIKLKKKGICIGKRGGPLTPVPGWKMEAEAGPSTSMAKLSARELGASLWEIQDLFNPRTQPKMMSKRRQRLLPQLNLSDSSQPNSPIKIQRASRSMRRVAASFDQKDRLVERSTGDPIPQSPESYYSSLEVSDFNQAITPSSSFDLKGRYTIKTSTELLKVLNRIWSLEEQLASNVSLVETLKAELHHACSRIQELVQEQQAYHHEMDNLMKRVLEERLTRKQKERDRIKTAVQSVKNELEDEKKMRRQSESLHRKLGKEFSEMKSAFTETLNDLESERKARALLEDLCDEFAKGIWEYEQEAQNPKQKFESLHCISNVWMNERLQMKMAEARGEEVNKNKILEMLNFERTSFPFCLRDGKGNSLLRHSLESVHLNGAISAPQDADDDDSVASDSHCFELNMEVKENVSHPHLKQNGGGGIEKSGESMQSNVTKENLSIRSHVTPVGKGSAINSSDSHNLSSVVSQSNIRHASSDLDISGSSSKLPQSVKENSLKGKLLEARLEGRYARLRALRGSASGLQQ